ncbi:MFS transporter [Dankookia sp. P2]|uniref:MFS transporter n=1 Tax=Dankookia sp. P2 TaxID=3423955 RepID=UPI003D675C9C
MNLCVAALALVAAASLFLTTLRPVDGPRKAGAAAPSLRAALSPRVLNLLAMGVAERICYGLTAVYFATFLQSTYQLSLGQVAVPLALFALGNIGGTIIGGQPADRLRDRMLTFAAAMAASGLVAVALFGWQAGLVPTVALGFGYVFLNAIARPSLMAAMANVPDEVRGTVLGLNVTSASFGWLGRLRSAAG